MQNEIEKLIQDIVADYANWQAACAARNADTCNKVQNDMFDRFKSRISFKEGKKYIKIFTEGGSVWGFVVKQDDAKFRKGDILKAAGWNAPARNAARGNIIDGGYSIQWTGPLYLK